MTANSVEPTERDGIYVHSFRPRFYEIDSQGVMFNMWYLAYVDDAMGGFFMERGLPYQAWGDLGVDAHVAHVEVDWKSGIGGYDSVDVLMSASRIGNKSFTLDFAFRCGNAITCAGSIVYVLFATDGSGTTVLPPALVEALGDVKPLHNQ